MKTLRALVAIFALAAVVGLHAQQPAPAPKDPPPAAPGQKPDDKKAPVSIAGPGASSSFVSVVMIVASFRSWRSGRRRGRRNGR